VTPIQLYNKATDPFPPAVKPELFAALRDLDRRGLIRKYQRPGIGNGGVPGRGRVRAAGQPTGTGPDRPGAD
jgi:hypothetical protein